MISGKTIFIAPLDWGLGHATRCVPVIRGLQANNNVIIGTTPLTEKILHEEFPELEKIPLPPYNIRYSSVLPLWLKLVCSGPHIFGVIREEHKKIRQIIPEYGIDVVISDNRFGLFSKTVRSIFITHQLFLKAPFANAFVQRINKKYIRHFDEVWIPDYESPAGSLSGELSHGKHFHSHVTYIGPHTRLQKKELQKKRYDYLVLLSGPEPQCSILKNMLLEKAVQFPELVFAFAMPSEAHLQRTTSSHIHLFFSGDRETLSELISQSDRVICRSGYSTLMDLHLLGKKKLILIPTPGQTEQEYLAGYWRKTFDAKIVLQKELSAFTFN